MGSSRSYSIALAVLIGLGVLRSSIATRLDGFSVDEPYHIVAGVSYVRTGDFRLNPEHPPLVKLTGPRRRTARATSRPR